MFLAFIARIPAIAWVLALMVVLAMLLWKQHEQNVELQVAIKTVQEERSHAEAEKTRLIESDRKHASELAKARKANTESAARFRKAPDDGCLDRRLPDALGSLLRVPAQNRKAGSPSSGGPKADAGVPRNDLPGRAGPHPGTPGVGDAMRGRQVSDPPDIRK